MAKKIGDLLEGRSVPEQTRRERVTKKVSPAHWRGDTRMPQRPLHGIPDDVAIGRLSNTEVVENEHVPYSRSRASLPQIRSESPPQDMWEREDRATTGLASADVDGAPAPVDILDL